jgi:co-chaperonin GroES (HSP10)
VTLNGKLTKVSQTVRPLQDYVLVQRLEYEHPILAVIGVTLQKGIVVAVGPGKRKRRRVRFDLLEGHMSTQRSLYFEDGPELSGKLHLMPVKAGEVVEFSPRNQIEWEYEGQKLVWIKAGAIYGTTNDSKAEALLWQQSAGTDRHGSFLGGNE